MDTVGSAEPMSRYTRSHLAESPENTGRARMLDPIITNEAAHFRAMHKRARYVINSPKKRRAASQAGRSPNNGPMLFLVKWIEMRCFQPFAHLRKPWAPRPWAVTVARRRKMQKAASIEAVGSIMLPVRKP